MSENMQIMIVAGEASGDAHAARLVRAFREISSSDAVFFGSAGPAMRDEGVEAIVESDSLSIVGLAEIAAALPMFAKAKRKLVSAAKERQPDIAVLVDFPDFNLRLARSLKKLGIPVVYYISPQLWAWRKYRLSTVKRNVDLMLTILPFEEEWYAKHGFDKVEYVGSPLAREVRSDRSKAEFCRDHSLDPSLPIISLLPGSRQKEISRIMPVLTETAALMSSENREIQFLIPLSSQKHRDVVVDVLKRSPSVYSQVNVFVGETYDALNASDAAAVTSGTATMEAGLIGTPLVVVYKTSAINYKLLEPLIDVEHYGLINLVAGKRVAAEMIQDEFTPENLAGELFRLLKTDDNARARSDLAEAAKRLGEGGASKRAAEAILRLINERGRPNAA